MSLPCALYARISVSDPNTPKVEIQLADLRKLAAVRGYDVVAEYTDDGLSAAKAENRPDFDRMMTDLAARRFVVILATEEARLARNNLEKNALLLTCVQAGATWETIRDGAVDPATAAGSFMAVIRGAVDAFESKRKAERQRTMNAHRRDSGQPQPGQRPFGWQIVGAKPIRFEPVVQEQALVRWGIEMILSGSKPWAVVKAWNGTGIKTGRGNDWSSTSVISVLRRWRNAGWTEHQGEPVAQAQWNAICTREEHEAVLAILASRPQAEGWKTPSALCSGIARCECGMTLVRTGNSWGYAYRCRSIVAPGAKSGIHVAIKCTILDAAVRTAVVASYFLDPTQTESADVEATALAGLHADLRDVREQRDKLLDLYMEPGSTLTKAAYNKRAASLATRESEIETTIGNAARSSAHAAMLSEARELLFAEGNFEYDDVSAVAVELRARFDALDLESQRRLVVGALDSITVHRGRGDERIEIYGRALGGKPRKLPTRGEALEKVQQA